MSIKKKDDHWVVDLRPDGAKGKRIIRKFRTKAEAIRFESFIISEATAGKPWNPKLKDTRLLSELIDIWSEEHASTLSSGEKYHKKLKMFCSYLNNPPGHSITTQQVSRWRSDRLKDVKANTANNDLQTVKNLFNWLKKRGHIEFDNPGDGIGRVKTHEQERPYLTKEQVIYLYEHLPKHYDRDVAIITQICIETGARWSEAQNLTRERVKKDRVIFTETKSKKTRAIPISQELSGLIENHPEQDLFRNCESTARLWLNQLLGLPKGISTHILRHTFASHFVMAGGNILTLQRILGHSKIEMTMRYAHLAPEHLEDALVLNPRAIIEK